MARLTFFYPSLIWPGGRIDFDEAYRISVPTEEAVGSRNLAASGLQETVIDRDEVTIALTFWPITSSRLNEIRTWYQTWAKKGNRTTLILDRFDTCSGQYEYDQFNRFFSKAILINNPLSPARRDGVESRASYTIVLQFRQDGGS